MFFRYLLYAFLIYLAYKLIFEFIIPVFKTTRQVKKDFQKMKNRMEDQMNQQNRRPSTSPIPDIKEKIGDYIDFEEVK